MSSRPAATVVLARPFTGSGGGIDVMVLRRSSRNRFAKGFVVFPGGLVEEKDAELAKRWFGSETEAARACALRELGEETGLFVTSSGMLDTGGRSMHELDPVPQEVASMPEIARWIGPERVPIPFDTRFYALSVSGGAEPRPDGTEAEAVWWSRPKDLLGSYQGGEIELMWPTLKILEALATCPQVKDVLSLRINQTPTPLGFP